MKRTKKQIIAEIDKLGDQLHALGADHSKKVKTLRARLHKAIKAHDDWAEPRREELHRRINELREQLEPPTQDALIDDIIQRLNQGTDWGGFKLVWLSAPLAILKRGPFKVWVGFGCPYRYVAMEYWLISLEKNDLHATGTKLSFKILIATHEGRLTPEILTKWTGQPSLKGKPK